MGSKGNGKNDFVGPGFAWHGLSILSDLRLQGPCANGVGTSLAQRVPDKRPVFLGSKGNGKHFVGLRFA